MVFEVCVAYALRRTYAHGVMIENPMDMLQEIYAGREPFRKLEEWVGKFLVAMPDTSCDRHMELPNIFALESEQGPWRARLPDAMEASGALEDEVRKAWEE
jgi:hypothetical protein